LDGIVNLDEEKKRILAVVRKSDFAPKDLASLLKDIIENGEKTWNRDILTRWNTARFRGTKYNEGENFYRLVAHPDSISRSNDFRTSAGSDLATLIESKKDPYDVIGPIMKYRIIQYMGKTESERNKDYKPEEIFELINEADRHYGQEVDGFTGTVIKSGKQLKENLLKAIGKGRGEALSLDFNKPDELQVIIK